MHNVMKTRILTLVAIITTVIISALSCSDPSEVNPVHQTVNTDIDNRLGPTGTIGRMLFYDTHLSENNTVSCASCHKQSLAFGDNKPFSPGFMNDPSLRNSIAIQNVSFGNLFWDGRGNDLGSMVLMPIFNHVEMGMDNSDDLVARVKNLAYYHDVFKQAFGDDEITISRISMCLADFVSRITAFRSRFDTGALSALESQGKELFFNTYDCGSCHALGGSGIYGFTVGFVNIGLDANSQDGGRFDVTNDPADRGKFRIPTLMNIAVTAPYIHDGPFNTLEEVLDHYSHGIANTPNLDPTLRDANGSPLQMNIPQQDKEALIAFLNALTDNTMISSSMFASPFKR
jgi:cytochrome c peroxidase